MNGSGHNGQSMQETADQVRSINTCINNLISIVALPAIWTGRESPEIVTVLMDVLLNMLRLDSVYVTLNSGASRPALEMIRSIHSQDAAELEVLLKETLQQSRACEAWPFTIRRSMESDMVPGSRIGDSPVARNLRTDGGAIGGLVGVYLFLPVVAGLRVIGADSLHQHHTTQGQRPSFQSLKGAKAQDQTLQLVCSVNPNEWRD